MRKGFHEPVEKPRRFYKTVEVGGEAGAFQVQLDCRTVRSPHGGVLALPTRALADLVAAEWQAQTDVIEMAQMHATRLAFTALEGVAKAREATAAQLAHYAASDMLCYFAEDPAALADRQAERWGPVLERGRAELELVFLRASGIVHRQQLPETLAKVEALALDLDNFALAGVAFGAALYGSALLALALQRGWLDGAQAFELSYLDETFQQETWGVDEEAAERAARLLDESKMLERWFRALDAA